MNVTPMIDVLLVLIIVFMIINTASTSTGLDAVAPKPPIKNGEVQPRTVVIQLAEAQGGQPTLTINQEPVSWEGLRARLIDVYKTRAERVLFVKADSDVEFEQVARVIDTAHGAFGDMKVGLMHEWCWEECVVLRARAPAGGASVPARRRVPQDHF